MLSAGAMSALLFAASIGARAEEPAKAEVPMTSAGFPEASFEIFKLAPGKQEEFIRRIARADQVLAAGGQPPQQLFFHEDGADWDVLIFKPERRPAPTAEQKAAMAAKRKELGIESGPAYFVALRELVAAHTDTETYGPVSAAQWLERLDAWRAAHPSRPAAAR
ncbi:hypothetical protein [Sphingopyxis terrae]|uniref:hypothetical protein n=1 Tax=Sphingopyxis terrae TaxID=33052 RepID=UPI003F7D8513